MLKNKVWLWSFLILILGGTSLFAGEADIKIPDLDQVFFPLFGQRVSGISILMSGLFICALGVIFGLVQYKQTRHLPVHASMAAVSNIIWETCKTYLMQQGRFLVYLWLLIAACMM